MWSRLFSPFKEFGILAGSLYAVDRILRRFSPKTGMCVYEMMVQPIGDKRLLPINRAKNLAFAEIARGDPAIALMPARPEIKAARFDQGASCVGVFRSEKLIGYAWFCFNSYEEDEVRCTYELAEADQSVFDFDFYIFPEYRMGTAFLAVWQGANEYLRARNIRYTFSRMTRFNEASRRAHAHLGSKCVGRALFFQAWHVELMVATLFPFVFLSWSEKHRPRLRLAPAKPNVGEVNPSANVS